MARNDQNHNDDPVMNLGDLEAMTVQELYEVARKLGIAGVSKLRKKELVFEILKVRAEKEGLLFGAGILEIMTEGFGFLRVAGLNPSPDDIYVSPSQIRRFALHAEMTYPAR